jgi:ribonuclease J
MSNPNVRIISLGGIGSIGKNMTLIEQDDEILVIDCGLMFPDENHPGVDIILPDMTYLYENAERISGVVLTHGHEDHIGGLPYLLERMPLIVWGTPLTLGLLQSKLPEYRPIPGYEFISVEPGTTFKVGGLDIDAVAMSHSVPAGVALGIHTKEGIIVHSGDFKFDQTPIDGRLPDFHTLAGYGSQGTLCLISDTTNVERPGMSLSERVVGENFQRIFCNAPGRIVVTSFASNISRMQQVMDRSAECGRKVSVSGRSMERIMQTALDLGYLTIPADTLVPIERIDDFAPTQVTILTTGSQGEPLSALARMARGDHRWVEIGEDDTVIFSASAIPGNETVILNTINELYRRGAHVIYRPEEGVHVSGHAYQEEMRLLISLVRPRYVIPIHGDQRHICRYRELTTEMGIPKENCFLLEPGATVDFQDGMASRGPKVPAGSVNVDGLGVGDVGDVVIADRHILASEGILLPVLVVDAKTFLPVAEPEVYSRGFVFMSESEDLIAAIKVKVLEVVAAVTEEGRLDPELLYERLRSQVGKYLFSLTERRPMIVPVIIPVGERAQEDEATEELDEEPEPLDA